MLSVALATPLQSVSAQSPCTDPWNPICKNFRIVPFKSIMSSLI